MVERMYFLLLPLILLLSYIGVFWLRNRQHKWWKGLILQIPFLTKGMRLRILSLSGNPLIEKIAWSNDELIDWIDIFGKMSETNTVKKGMKSLKMNHFYDYYWKTHALIRQNSPYVNPMQQPYWFYAGLRSKPFWDTSEFPWAKILEDNYAVIKEEMLKNINLFQPYRIIENNKYLKVGGGLCTSKEHKPGWMMLYLWHNGPVTCNMEKCPKTSQLLQSIHYYRQYFACFSALSKRTRIGKHVGPTNAVLRCHLAVHVPEPDKLSITVGGETRHWDEGKVLILDDSFEHFVTHESDLTRVVLFFDVWHPDWSPEEVDTITKHEDDLMKKFSTVPGSFINRMDTAFVEDKNVVKDTDWFIHA